MSATAYFPISPTLKKHVIIPSLEDHSQYAIFMSFSEEATPLPLRSVHIPPAILAAFEAGQVAGFVARFLYVNSTARRRLSNGPEHLVTCVQLKDGSLLKEEPLPLRKAKMHLWSQIVLSSATAGVLLSFSDGPLFAWIGALSLVVALRWYREVCHMPRTDFKVYSTVVPKTSS